MFTVHRQGKNRSNGMGYEYFVSQFETLCEEHMKNGQARAFAFVFYNIKHKPIMDALNSESGFEILDKASGKDITLYYLHSDGIKSLENAFNRRFLKYLNLTDQYAPPCIVFFRVYERAIDDIECHNLDTKTKELHLINAELRRHIRGYVDRMNKEGDLSGLTSVAKAGFLAYIKGASIFKLS
jgi:hypothetical protein